MVYFSIYTQPYTRKQLIFSGQNMINWRRITNQIYPFRNHSSIRGVADVPQPSRLFGENQIGGNHGNNEAERTRIGIITQPADNVPQNKIALFSLPDSIDCISRQSILTAGNLLSSPQNCQASYMRSGNLYIWEMDINRYPRINERLAARIDKFIISQEVLLSGEFNQILEVATTCEKAITLLIDTRTPAGLDIARTRQNDYTLAHFFNIIDLNPDVHEGLYPFNRIIRENRSYTDEMLNPYMGTIDGIIDRVITIRNDRNRNRLPPRNNPVVAPVVIGHAYEVHNINRIYQKLNEHVKLPQVTDNPEIERHWTEFCSFVETGNFGVGSASAKNLLDRIRNNYYPEITWSVKAAVAQAMSYCNNDKNLLATYVVDFLTDAANAYGNDNISCTKGILERAKCSVYNIYMIHTQDQTIKPYIDAIQQFLAISDLPMNSSTSLTPVQEAGFNIITRAIQAACSNSQKREGLLNLIKSGQDRSVSQETVEECIKYIIKEAILPDLKDEPDIIDLLAKCMSSRERVKDHVKEWLNAILEDTNN